MKKELTIPEVRRLVFFMSPFIALMGALFMRVDIIGIMLAIFLGIVLGYLFNFIIKKIFKE